MAGVRTHRNGAGRIRAGRIGVAGLVAGVALVALAAPAGAHVEPDKSQVKAGSTEEITFTVPHGCDGSATTKVAFEIPAGVTDPTPGTATGFTGAVVGNQVVFTGNLPDGTEGSFPITMTFPTTVGTTLEFPAIQTCEQGEIAWIEHTVEGQDEPEHPAPHLTIGTETVAATADDEEATSDAGGSTTTEQASGAVTASPRTTTDSDDGSSGTTVAIVVGAVAIVIAAGAGIAVSRRKGGTPGGPAEG